MPPDGITGFAITVLGRIPLTDQWFFNNVTINGVTRHSLLLTNVSTAQEGSDTVQITHGSGHAHF